jgi:hypothetical protein
MEKQPTIFDLFRILADGNETIISGIDIIEGGTLPPKDAKKLAQDIWFTMCPTTPPGRRLSPDTMWTRGTGKFIWMCLVEPNEVKTKWLAQQIKWGRHKERPMFLPRYHQPMPSPRKW